MIKLERTEVYGWESAIRGMRNPMNSWEKSDTIWLNTEYGDYRTILGNMGPFYGFDHDEVNQEYGAEDFLLSGMYIGPEDRKLMMNLAKSGTTHSKYRRMINVTVDITAPFYWWKEFDTYKIGTVANSCSTMHKIQAKEFTLEDFSCEHLFESPYLNEIFDDSDIPDFDKEFLDDMDKWQEESKKYDDKFFMDYPNLSINDVNPIPDSSYEREEVWLYEQGAYDTEPYNVNPEYYEDQVIGKFAKDVLMETIKALNYYRKKFLETKDKCYWWQMIQLLPTSYNQKRTVQLNYEVLAGIYPNRKDHKLDEWHVFCDWIKTLPYSELITLEEDVES